MLPTWFTSLNHVVLLDFQAGAHLSIVSGAHAVRFRVSAGPSSRCGREWGTRFSLICQMRLSTWPVQGRAGVSDLCGLWSSGLCYHGNRSQVNSCTWGLEPQAANPACVVLTKPPIRSNRTTHQNKPWRLFSRHGFCFRLRLATPRNLR